MLRKPLVLWLLLAGMAFSIIAGWVSLSYAVGLSELAHHQCQPRWVDNGDPMCRIPIEWLHLAEAYLGLFVACLAGLFIRGAMLWKHQA